LKEEKDGHIEKNMRVPGEEASQSNYGSHVGLGEENVGGFAEALLIYYKFSLSNLSFVVGSLVGEDDELDVVVATFVVILRMEQLRMLLVSIYWLAFTDDWVPNLAIPYSHPWPKLIFATIKILMHL
jgi:hypothetical protein